MIEQTMATEAAQAAAATAPAEKPADRRPTTRTISKPREVAALVLAHIERVNAKKDDLTVVLKGLADLARQLADSYGLQMQVIGELSNRLKALEAKANDDASKANAAVKKTAARAKRVA